MTNASPLVQAFLAHGTVEDCPIIDMHTHPGPYQAIYFPNGDPERMIASMDRANVRLICAVSHCALVDTGRGNAWTESLTQRFPGRVLGYWSINPNYPERVRQEVADYPKHTGFIGFKFLADYHRQPITCENYAPALEYADAHGLLMLLHTWGGSAYDSPAHVEELAKRYPNTVLLMGHCGYGEWDRSIGIARDYPNVYLELTGAHDANGAIEKMVAGAGSHKMLYGTDLPWFDPLYVAGCILGARISDDDRHNILHRTAEKLLAKYL